MEELTLAGLTEIPKDGECPPKSVLYLLMNWMFCIHHLLGWTLRVSWSWTTPYFLQSVSCSATWPPGALTLEVHWNYSSQSSKQSKVFVYNLLLLFYFGQLWPSTDGPVQNVILLFFFLVIIRINISSRAKKMAPFERLATQAQGWFSTPNTHIKYLAQWFTSETPEVGSRDSQAEAVSYRLHERPAVKNKIRNVQGYLVSTSGLHMHTCANALVQHIKTHTHTQLLFSWHYFHVFCPTRFYPNPEWFKWDM